MLVPHSHLPGLILTFSLGLLLILCMESQTNPNSPSLEKG